MPQDVGTFRHLPITPDFIHTLLRSIQIAFRYSAFGMTVAQLEKWTRTGSEPGHQVIMVSDLIRPEIVTNMHLEYAKTPDETLGRAYELQGSNAEVAGIPDGLAVIVR
jgi:hypothetical protein